LSVAKAYGVIEGDSKYCARHTVYIGKDGKVLFVDNEVHPASAGADVAERLEKLGLGKTE
jgi:thioredoxin-dependent peroxiredoxin